MATQGFNLKYDPDTDVLSVAFGPAKKAVSVEREPDVFVRHDPKTGRIVGLTVLGFKQFLSHKQELSLPPTAAL